jgi:fructose-1,6-bisphosphatase I
MTRKPISLTRFLIQEQHAGHINADLRLLIEVVARACKTIATAVGKGELGGVLGDAGTWQRAGRGAEETRRAVQRNPARGQRMGRPPRRPGVGGDGTCAPRSRMRIRRATTCCCSTPSTAARTSTSTSPSAPSSRCCNARTGIIEPSDEHFLQPGTAQVCAGYTIYGPSTLLVLTIGRGTHAFTLDREQGSFMLTRATSAFRRTPRNSRSTAPTSGTGAADAALRRRPDRPAGRPRGKDFNMRWVASMVADVHRILTRGGIFIYPPTARTVQARRLRLMYEANPMAFIVEQAGGAATTGRSRLMDVQPTGLHQRVPVFLGSRHEVDVATRYHLEHDALLA